MGSPLYRQEQELKRQGIPISRQTMSNWVLRAAADYLTPVYAALHRDLLRREVLHADETTLQVLHEPGKKPQSESYMWLYRTGGLSSVGTEERPAVRIPARTRREASDNLPGGLPGLSAHGRICRLPQVARGNHGGRMLGSCAAQVRRGLKSIAKGHASAKNIREGLDFCNRLFAIEQKLADLPAQERYTQRLEQAKPVLDELFCIRPSPVRTGRWLHSAIASNGSR